MEFKNSNQLMEYWETKVKEFEKDHVLLKQKNI